MAGVNISAIQDILNLTRDTELNKGSWVSLASELNDYPLNTVLMPRVVRRSSYQYAWSLTSNKGPTPATSDGYAAVNDPIQVAVIDQSDRASVQLSKTREAISYSRDEEELQGTEEEELVDIVLARKAERLDLPLLSSHEHKFAGDGTSGAGGKTPILGLKYWLPALTTATDLQMNGGGDPAQAASGAAGVLVATVPRWAHAVCGYTKVSDDDLFAKLHEFRIRVNYHVPEGSRALDSSQANRIVLVQHPVFEQWARLQTAANDDLRSDVGMWRGALNFMGTPVRFLPVISTPGDAETPSGSGLFYDLDLNTWRYQVHSSFGFDMEVADKADTPGTIHAWREGYSQLICVNREKNLVGYTTTSDLIVS